MSYYTRYVLTVDAGPADQGDYCNHCGGTGKVTTSVVQHLPQILEEPQTWYDHEQDMMKFSKKYPNTTFRLTGEGEEQGDVWVKFFKNGQVQGRKATITLDDSTPTDWTESE